MCIELLQKASTLYQSSITMIVKRLKACYGNCYRLQPLFYRQKCSLNLWHEDINTTIKIKIENHWRKEVSQTSKTNENKKEAYYVLPMFPYPSGSLHMGHVRVYSISDTLARFQKLIGKNTVHPIGWDAFGLPAENAAIERNIPPSNWTKSNISSMKEQLLQMGFHFDWDKEVSTCDPNYYKWTQFIFLKLYEKGLAYQSKAQVNWDPVDRTVLADEQVDDLGCSWRSGAKVEKKYLTQWFIKTTKLAKDLYDGLNSEKLENWKDIINLQKHWIGACDGVVVTFQLKMNETMKPIDVWTSEPYKLIHGNFLTISPSNVLIQELGSQTNKLMAVNPINNCEIPVYITDIVVYPEGRDIYLACPMENEKDKEIAASLSIPIKDHNILDIHGDGQRAIDIALKKSVGGHFVSSKLKDWLISRQRYWGTPIPMIHCNDCGAVPVPYESLPVKLPAISASAAGIQTLTKENEWVNCKCPKCNSNAQRETDTMDTFVDSSWYYYRFLDPQNENAPFDKECLENHTPVDIYVGGKEHAVLHLYYARFMSYFLHSLGWTPTPEPFKKLLVQGMVMGQSYKLKSSGKYLPPASVEKIGREFKEKESGEPVLVQWEKMSKSKHNGENPERLLSDYGCDTTRLLILADVPPATPRKWSDATLPGVLNWQHRLWMTIREFIKLRNDTSIKGTLSKEQIKTFEDKIRDARNYFTATATFHFKYTQMLSVGISRLQSLTSTLRNRVPPEVVSRSIEYEEALAVLLIMLAPVIPHFSCELWAGFLSAPHRVSHTSRFVDWNKNVLEQRWPTVDDEYRLSFQCKVDGADGAEIKIKAADLPHLSHDKALQAMLNEVAIQKRIKSGISHTKYELYPDCRAILHIYSNRSVKSKNIGDVVENINS